MTNDKKAQKKNFSHMEMDKLRATFIENTETAEKLNQPHYFNWNYIY